MPEDAGAPPEEFGDVLDSPGRDAHEAHLDDGLLDRSLAPAIALDNGRLEGRAAQLRNVELDLSWPGDELSRVVAAAVCLPARRPLVARSAPTSSDASSSSSASSDPSSTDAMFADAARAPLSSVICCLVA